MLAAWVKTERERRGWSQAELARRAGLSQPAIALLERSTRQPRPETVEGVARAFGLPSAEELYRLVYGSPAVDPLTNGAASSPLDRLAAEGIPPHILAEIGELAQELSEQDWDYLLAFARSRAEEYRRQQQPGKQTQQRRREGTAYQGGEIQAAEVRPPAAGLLV